MKRRIALLAVAVGPSAIAVIAAAFVSFASGSLSSPGPYGSTATASAPSGAAPEATVDTPNSPLGNRPHTASAVTTHGVAVEATLKGFDFAQAGRSEYLAGCGGLARRSLSDVEWRTRLDTRLDPGTPGRCADRQFVLGRASRVDGAFQPVIADRRAN
jgi:hypothetical protein